METTEPGPGQRQPDPGDQEEVRTTLGELRALASTFADTSPGHMTPQFYANAFNEYDIAIRALLGALPENIEDLGRYFSGTVDDPESGPKEFTEATMKPGSGTCATRSPARSSG